MIQYGSVIVLILVTMYLIVGYVMMKSLNIDGKRLFYMPWITLYIMII